MSDHVSKKNQANAGRTDTTGINLKPVTDVTKLIREGVKAATTASDGKDKVPDNDREMDLTFYDANGNVETVDPDGDISMEDDTTVQSIENDGDASSAIDEPISANTSVTTASDGAADSDRDVIMHSIEQIDASASSIDDLFSSDDDMAGTNGGLDENGSPDDNSAAELDFEAPVASSPPKLINRDARGNSVPLTKDGDKSVPTENRGYHSEDDDDAYEYQKYAFREKRLRLKNKAQRSKKRCDDQASDGDSEMP